MILRIILLTTFLASCASQKAATPPAAKAVPVKEFAPGELILATQLLTKIFDKEMAPLACVPDTDEASLLLRTIRPRMEVVQDDMEAMLDNSQDVEKLIVSCDKNCTCGHVDDLMREHLVVLSKKMRATLNAKKTDKELNRCLNYVQSTFCQSDLFKQLDKEKVDFSFEEVEP